MNNKNVITAVLLVSDGPIEHSYFEDLLKINNMELLGMLEQINTDLTNAEIGFYIKFDKTKSDIVTKSEISDFLSDVKPPPILRGLSTPALETLAIIAYDTSNKNESIRD